MINLIPISKIIAIVAVLYAAIIAALLTALYTPDVSILSNIAMALKGATGLNLLLILLFSFGWRWLWRTFPKLNHYFFPDLNGKWEMSIHWNSEKDSGIAYATAYIKQDFVRISMEVVSEDSESSTLLAKPKKDPESGRPILYYIYRNTPTQKNGNKDTSYDGTAVLKLNHDDFKILNGNYYTDRLTHGHYELKRTKTHTR
ncbi:hypothetical protein ST37_05105 [Vibrio sp. qd031]|uniref:Cap15 family cyclic dinucleotide receptor domain-containing protein n=1 Tax=Vibrio sp. qd031 TaxID=1603038 RepID=UPI000A105FD3|nr:hypothetical protein [Vibrio sp. qd031]ORT51726.1 hypothetical protein ST37_05105 [Vibrio sp. qd031]